MSIKYFFLVVLLSLSITGCRKDTLETAEVAKDMPDWAQCRTSNSEHNPCQVSVYALVTTPSMYDGMYVEFVGYFPSKGARLLFVNRDAAESSDYLSSLLMESSFESGAGYYKVKSRFFHDSKDSGLASGVYRQNGRLQGVKIIPAATSIAELSTKCEDGTCEAYYINGVVPAVRGRGGSE